MLEYWKLVLEALRAIAWPAAVVWIAWYYRTEFRAAFDRVVEMGPTGFKLSPPPSPPTQVPSPPTGYGGEGSFDVRTAVENIKQFISPEQVEPLVANIKKQIVEKTHDKDAVIDFLSHSAASLSIQVNHERTYALIHGSQLRFLVKANDSGGLDPDAARHIYNEAAAAYPDAYRNFSI